MSFVAHRFSSAVIPTLIGGGYFVHTQWDEHWEHWSHMPPLEERTEYPYQNIRVKNFPWGDGDKVSFSFCISYHHLYSIEMCLLTFFDIS